MVFRRAAPAVKSGCYARAFFFFFVVMVSGRLGHNLTPPEQRVGSPSIPETSNPPTCKANGNRRCWPNWRCFCIHRLIWLKLRWIFQHLSALLSAFLPPCVDFSWPAQRRHWWWKRGLRWIHVSHAGTLTCVPVLSALAASAAPHVSNTAARPHECPKKTQTCWWRTTFRDAGNLIRTPKFTQLLKLGRQYYKA